MIAKSNIKVVKNAEKPESKEILAEAIVRIGKAMDDLTKSGLNERAIVALINFETKIGLGDIRTVLAALKKLRGWYCR
jgi:hypothetical protein